MTPSQRATPSPTPSSAEIYDLRADRVLYQFNGDKLVAPGSAAKLLTESTALAILGPADRFHTAI